jgi:hypothetical protein
MENGSRRKEICEMGRKGQEGRRKEEKKGVSGGGREGGRKGWRRDRRKEALG